MWLWALIFIITGIFLAWIVGKAHEYLRTRNRESMEDVLKFLIISDPKMEGVPQETVAGFLGLSRRAATTLINRLYRDGLIRFQSNRILLTAEGRKRAIRILRAHRLLEYYLVYATGLPLRDIHRYAEKQEHRITPEALRDLAARIGYPLRDPHGDPIPDEDGNLPIVASGKPLTDVSAPSWVRVVHIEDEPAHIFAQIISEGIEPYSSFLVLENLPKGIHIQIDGRDIWLAPIVANNITVQVLSDAPSRMEEQKTLADVEIGTRVRVIRITPRIQGLLRRRLLDLGFTPGAKIKPVLRSAFGRGDPTAYLVRGSMIALRKEQAREILVKEEFNETSSA